MDQIFYLLTSDSVKRFTRGSTVTDSISWRLLSRDLPGTTGDQSTEMILIGSDGKSSAHRYNLKKRRISVPALPSLFTSRYELLSELALQFQLDQEDQKVLLESQPQLPDT